MRPILCLVTDRRLCERPLADLVAAAVRGGVDWIQLRERDLGGGALLALADRVIAAARRSAGPGRDVRVVVNRRLDVALAAGADGAHLGFDALPIAIARTLLGPAALLGASTHTPDELHDAAHQGASYAHLAPIFPPLSKPAERPPLGLAALEAARASIPVLAQGGLEPSNAASAIQAGAAGIAVTGAILSAPDPQQAARKLREALDGA